MLSWLTAGNIIVVMSVNKPRGGRKASASTTKAAAARRGETGRQVRSTSGRFASTAKAPPEGSSGRGSRRAVELVVGLESKLEAAEQQLAELRDEITDSPSADDPFAVVGAIFADELRVLLGDARPDPGAARRAARLALAEQAWEQRLGQLLETRDVVELLKISKQRISALAREHRLIALPQAGRSRFPAWQFTLADANDRACLAAAHHRLVDTGHLSPWSAASWFQAPHPELGGQDPVSFLRAGGDQGRILQTASRDAERAGQ
jgi:hypothetical protein